MAARMTLGDKPLDILAIAAHRDDVEQTCGGTLLRAAQRGQRTGVLDLTQGELGTRGTAEDRAREAGDAAHILGASWREALDIPDGRVENTWDNRLKVAAVIRATRPRVVILPYWKGRHPDHYTASVLGYEACFLAGLAKLDVGSLAVSDQPSAVRNPAEHAAPAGVSDDALAAARLKARPDTSLPGTPRLGSARLAIEQAVMLSPHRPFKIIYATLYYDIRPTFVVDISDQFEGKLASILAYTSQFSDQEAGKGLFPAHEEIRVRVDAMARFYGMLGGVTYAEPFLQKEVGLVDDLLAIPVKSI
jgi:LmbE family N-acetylglucosaminyl deacetylase